jgi:hypothetical protein
MFVGPQVTLLRSQVDVRADCVNFRDVTSQQIMLLYGRENVVMANNRTLTLLGQHTSRMPIQDIKTGAQGESTRPVGVFCFFQDAGTVSHLCGSLHC